MAINFGLAPQPLNPLQALQIYGQAREQAVERRNAEAKIAAQAKVTDALAKGDTASAQTLLAAAGDWQGVTALEKIGENRRQAAGREKLASYLSTTGPSATPTAAPLASGQTDNGDIVVNAPRVSLSDLVRADPELAKQALEIQKNITGLDKARLDQLAGETELVGAVTTQMLQMPPAQRQAFLEANRSRLNAAGVDDNEIADFLPDLNDATLQTIQRTAIGTKAALQMDQDESQFVRRQAQDEAQSARSAAISIRGQNMTDARVRESNMIQAVGVGKNQRKTETDLRKEFEALPDVKAFRDVRSAFNQVKALSKRNDGQSDNALIYSYMKMLDPGSVVREGEFALAGRAAGISERITNVLQRADNGQSLTPRMRQEIASAAAQVYTQRRNTYNTTADQFQGYARDYGVDPKRVARKYVPQGRPSAPAGFKVLAIKRGQ